MSYPKYVVLVGVKIANSKIKVHYMAAYSVRRMLAVTPRVALKGQRLQGRCKRNECNNYSDQHHVSF